MCRSPRSLESLRDSRLRVWMFAKGFALYSLHKFLINGNIQVADMNIPNSRPICAAYHSGLPAKIKVVWIFDNDFVILAKHYAAAFLPNDLKQ